MPLFLISMQHNTLRTSYGQQSRAGVPETQKKISANQTPLSSQPYTSMGGYRPPHGSPPALPACPPSVPVPLPVIGASLHRCNYNLLPVSLHRNKSVSTQSLIVLTPQPPERPAASPGSPPAASIAPHRRPTAHRARKFKFSPSARPPTQYFRQI